MGVIKNFKEMASTPQRKVVLTLIEEAFKSIEPRNVMESKFSVNDKTLKIEDKTYDLSKFNRVFLIGFGKGSAGICKIVEKKLGNLLTVGFDIDLVDESFQQIYYTKGTHPLPSQTNVAYTKQVLEKIKNLTETDLVLVVICGGGSAMFELPVRLPLERLIQVFKDLLKSGADISEMNVIRKHLSKVKGGGLAHHLYPATVASLIFSDVPGNDLSVIASGPTEPDKHTLEDTQAILKKYNLEKDLSPEDFEQTPTDEKYFANVTNIIMLSNQTALAAMQNKAKELGYKAVIFSDRVQGDAHTLGKMLIEKTNLGEILLAGGESTLKVVGTGKGGRNQTLVLSGMDYIRDETILASFDSDGTDFFYFTGALGDMQTIVKAHALSLDAKKYLDDDNSYEYWKEAGDGIFTDKLESNVSDLMIVSKI